MRCPYCGGTLSAPIEDAEVDGAVRRVRACPHCGRRSATWERLEPARLVVVKRDGRREDYSRHKLARSVALALARRPVLAQALEGLVERVEGRLFAAPEPEMSSELIGELVLEELRGLDEVAYLRFASYFRRFAGASDFVEAAEALADWRRRSSEARLQLPLDFEADQPHWA